MVRSKCFIIPNIKTILINSYNKAVIVLNASLNKW